MKRLFVYGTLAPGKHNHCVLAGLSGVWEPATVNGTLADEGWGSEHGCPGLIPSSAAPEIRGHVFTSEELMGYWDTLDRFEGDDYRRELITAKLSNGREVQSYVYSVNPTHAP